MCDAKMAANKSMTKLYKHPHQNITSKIKTPRNVASYDEYYKDGHMAITHMTAAYTN